MAKMLKISEVLLALSPIMLGIIFMRLYSYYWQLDYGPRELKCLPPEICMVERIQSPINVSAIFMLLSLASFVLAIFLPIFAAWRKRQISKNEINSIKHC
jgi:hypothetical protein